jgi:hypothetical protein
VLIALADDSEIDVPLATKERVAAAVVDAIAARLGHRPPSRAGGRHNQERP